MPPSLRRSGFRGLADVRVDIDQNGTPTAIRMVTPASRSLTNAALDVAFRSLYEPEIIGCRPVPYGSVVLNLSFSPDLLMATDPPEPRACSVPHEDAKLASHDPVAFPDGAVKLGLTSGSVLVSVAVDADGTARLARVMSSSNPIFNSTAVAVASSAVYKPATVDCRPVFRSVVFWRVPFASSGGP